MTRGGKKYENVGKEKRDGNHGSMEKGEKEAQEDEG